MLRGRSQRLWRCGRLWKAAVGFTAAVIFGVGLLSLTFPTTKSGTASSHSQVRQSLLKKHVHSRDRPAVPSEDMMVAPYRRLWRQLDSCGLEWQQEYVQLHNDIMTGRLPERTVVSVAVPTGEQPAVV